MVVFMGDIHLRDDKEYFKIICMNFLDWYKSWELNRPGNSLVLAGDLVENALLTGTVADYLEKFAMYSRFDGVYVCVGNHDIRKVNDANQLAYEFLKNKPTFHIYEEVSEIDVDGRKGLLLPYFKGVNYFGQTMGEYYGSLWNNPRFQKHYDFVLGHFNDESIVFGGELDVVRNLDKLDAGRILLGHIHTRYIRPDRYIGSVFACKKGENDSSRAVQILDDEGWREEPLPVFNEFINVTYPDRLPKSKCQVPIYTILNCGSESVARSKYGNVFIKKVTSNLVDSTVRRRVSWDSGFETIKNLNMMDMFDEFAKIQNPPLSQDVIDECKGYLMNR